MRTLLWAAVLACLTILNASAQRTESDEKELTKEQKAMLERVAKIKFNDGVIDFGHDIELTVPKGYKFLNKEDARYVVVDLWGNSKDAEVEGMLVKDDYEILSENGWAFVLSYEDCGYIKDEDADKIDYDDMMKEIKDSDKETNEARKTAGLGTAHVLGWASKPFYDKANNTLHWAKSIKFQDSEDTTLNYDVRILGRKGLLSLNAVGSTNDLNDVQHHIPDIKNIAKFKKGSSYFDFDEKTDKIAAYSIGGLVAGKVLAKAGLFALLLKNIKLVLFAVIGFFTAMRNRISGWFGGKKEEEVSTTDFPVYKNEDTQP